MSIDPKYLDDAWFFRLWRAQAAAVIQADLTIDELRAIQQATARQHLKRRIQQRIDAMQEPSWPLGPYHDERWPEGTTHRQYQALKADDTLTAEGLREALEGTSRLFIIEHLKARIRHKDHQSVMSDVPIYGKKLKLRKELAAVFTRDIVGLSKMGLIRSCIEAVCEYAIQHDVNVWEAARMVSSTETAETQADDIEDTRIEYDDEWDG